MKDDQILARDGVRERGVILKTEVEAKQNHLFPLLSPQRAHEDKGGIALTTCE